MRVLRAFLLVAHGIVFHVVAEGKRGVEGGVDLWCARHAKIGGRVPAWCGLPPLTVISEPASTACFDMIRRWIDECSAEHASCHSRCYGSAPSSGHRRPGHLRNERYRS